MLMAGKKNKKYQAAWLFVQKIACGWYVASKGPSFTPLKLIHSSLGGGEKRNVPRESINHRWGLMLL